MHTRSVLLARLRLRIPRGALRSWIALALLAALGAAVVNGALRRAHASQVALGPAVDVVVASTDLPPGSLLDGHARVEARPSKLVPRGALTAVPTGRVTTAFVAAGEPVLESRVSGTDAAGPAGLLHAGQRALTVPVGSVAPPVRVGDLVDVLATPVPGDPDTATRVVARGAAVVATGQDGITVAVPEAQAPALAAAVAHATVTLALTAPGDGDLRASVREPAGTSTP